MSEEKARRPPPEFEIRRARPCEPYTWASGETGTLYFIKCRQTTNLIVPSFEFLLAMPDEGDPSLTLLSTSIGAHAGWTAVAEGLGPDAPGIQSISNLRDMPLASWARQARSMVGVMATGLGVSFDSLVNDENSARNWAREDANEYLFKPGGHLDQATDELVQSTYPDLDADQSPAGKRRAASIRMLASATAEYRVYVNRGLRDPTAELAKRRGVSPSTARSWIHRARKAGLLGPALGRTPGEATPSGGRRIWVDAWTPPSELLAEGRKTAKKYLERLEEGYSFVIYPIRDDDGGLSYAFPGNILDLAWQAKSTDPWYDDAFRILYMKGEKAGEPKRYAAKHNPEFEAAVEEWQSKAMEAQAKYDEGGD